MKTALWAAAEVIMFVFALQGTTIVGAEDQKAIFVKIRLAAEAPTFEGAQVLLGQIKADDIVDPELASYYATSRKFADFCSDLGLPRGTYPGYLDIVAKLNYASVLAQLTKQGIQNAPSEAARLIGEALKLKDQISTYTDLDRQLAERYGLAAPAEAREISMVNCVGQYSWRTAGRTISFDLKSDGTFTAVDQPDRVDLLEGAGFVSEGKGRWRVRDRKLTIDMTHVWVVAYWKEHPTSWIIDEEIVKLTSKEIVLLNSAPLRRK